MCQPAQVESLTPVLNTEVHREVNLETFSGPVTLVSHSKGSDARNRTLAPTTPERTINIRLHFVPTLLSSLHYETYLLKRVYVIERI
jgi:hypothetical protein